MARTQPTGNQLLDGSVQRVDIDTTTAGNALIRKIIAGLGIGLTSTGVDAGTGDVTIKILPITPTLTNDTVATTETVIASWAIPANTLSAGNTLGLQLHGQVSSNATIVFRIRFGTAGTVADPLVALFETSSAPVANAHAFLQAVVAVLTSTTMTAGGFYNILLGSIYPVLTAAFAAATVNLTVANFLTVTMVQGATQTFTTRSAKLSA